MNKYSAVTTHHTAFSKEVTTESILNFKNQVSITPTLILLAICLGVAMAEVLLSKRVKVKVKSNNKP